MTICVAALTYKRPECLGRLLAAFECLEMPDDASVSILIVDNDPVRTAYDAVESAKCRYPALDIRYVVEVEPGIPAGRNRALDESLSLGADVLCFVDDDAWPDPLWLNSLIACYRESKAHLIFGPVRLYRPGGLRSLWKRFLAASIESRSRFLERFSEKESRRGRIARSGTGNWLGDLRWIARQEVRFDLSMRYTGGSDTAFRELARKKAARMVWCPKALVFEEIEEDRLSIRYQFKRARIQGMIAARFKRKIHPVIIRHPIGRIGVGIFLIVFPVFGLASFTLGLHQLGMGVGAIQFRRAPHSKLYSR